MVNQKNCEFSEISIKINIGMVFLASEVMEAVRGQKHPSEAKNIVKELIYWKKYLMKVSQQPQKPLGLSYDLK